MKKKNQFLLHDDHRKPVTRREFLASGIIPFAASMTLPTFGDIILRSAMAHAAGCDAGSGSGGGGWAPFLTINCEGGASLSANVVPLDAGGQLLPSYNKIGLGATATLPTTTEFNGVLFPANGISGVLTGIVSKTTAQTRANTAFVTIPHFGRDDTSDNKLVVAGLVQKAGLKGASLPSMTNFFRNFTVTGVQQDFAYIKPSNSLRVSQFTDIANAVKAQGALDKLSGPQKTGLFSLIRKLSEKQSEKLLQMTGGEVFKKLVDCGTEKNVELLSAGIGNTDPRANPDIAAVWGIAAATPNANQNLIAAAVVYNTLNGQAGTSCLQIGGCDYHNGTRTTGNAKDLEIGETIGRILQTAALMQSRVFIHVVTDGSNAPLTSNSYTAPWNSDRGVAGMSYIIAYDPAGRPATKGTQIGYFNVGQGAEPTFSPGTGASAERAAAAAFANYLSFNKKLSMFDSILPNVFNAADLDKVVKIG